MYYDIKAFHDRVTQGDDGVYRWVYRMNPRRNKHALLIVGKVFLSMGAISAAALFVIGPPNPLTMSVWDMPLTVLGVFLGTFLLVTALLYLQGDDPLPFSMDQEKIITYRSKSSGPHTFAAVRRVRLLPQYDAIRLGFGLTIYVPPEDYDQVKSFILDHIPASATIR